MQRRLVAVMAARLVCRIEALAQHRDQLIISARHHAGMAVMAGLDMEGHGGQNPFLSFVGAMHEAEGEIAIGAVGPGMHAVKFQIHVAQPIGGREVVLHTILPRPAPLYSFGINARMRSHNATHLVSSTVNAVESAPRICMVAAARSTASAMRS